jgi:hypothetical protein
MLTILALAVFWLMKGLMVLGPGVIAVGLIVWYFE